MEQPDGTTQTFFREEEPANEHPCPIYFLSSIVALAPRPGFTAFDELVLDMSGDVDALTSVREGREWVAREFGNGDLASLRLRAGLSQADLADQCNLRQPHVSRYESGRTEPLLSVASDMAEALGVSLDEFMQAWRASKRQAGAL